MAIGNDSHAGVLIVLDDQLDVDRVVEQIEIAHPLPQGIAKGWSSSTQVFDDAKGAGRSRSGDTQRQGWISGEANRFGPRDAQMCRG